MKFVKCKVEGCENNAYWRAHGCLNMCNAHYRRFKRHGSFQKQSRISIAVLWLKQFIATKETSCINWKFSKNKQGYGCLNCKGLPRLAHSAMCTLAHGARPNGADAAHSCGNPSCINPNHLRWATRSENMNDRLIHGTDARGEKSPVARLTQEQVEYLRAGARESQKELAQQWNVDPSTLSKAKNGKSWSWL